MEEPGRDEAAEESYYGWRIAQLPEEVAKRRKFLPFTAGCIPAIILPLMLVLIFIDLLPMVNLVTMLTPAIMLLSYIISIIVIRHRWHMDFDELSAAVRRNLIDGGILLHVTEQLDQTHQGNVAFLPVEVSKDLHARLDMVEQKYISYCQELVLQPFGKLNRFDSFMVNYYLLLILLIGGVTWLESSNSKSLYTLAAAIPLALSSVRLMTKNLMLPAAIKQALYDELGEQGSNDRQQLSVKGRSE